MFLKPSLVVTGNVTHISIDELVALGIRGLILDLDNTVMAPKSGIIEAPVQAWLDEARQKGLAAVILTNNKKLPYCLEAERVLGMKVIPIARKPAVPKMQEALDLLGLQPKQVAVVGDRPLTDVWGGQRVGAYTILVEPLLKDVETPLIKFLRRLERLSLHHG